MYLSHGRILYGSEPTSEGDEPMADSMIPNELAVEEQYVGFCRFKKRGFLEDGSDNLSFESCNSNDAGAFKVWRESALTSARSQAQREQKEKDAKIAEQFRVENPDMTTLIAQDGTAKDIATAIREGL